MLAPVLRTVLLHVGEVGPGRLKIVTWAWQIDFSNLVFRDND